MKITGIETMTVRVNHRGDWVFLKIVTDADITGLAEASHSGDDGLLAAEIGRFGRYLEGKDPLQANTLCRALHNPSRGRIHQTALSAVETALWDLRGRSLGVSIADLLGGPLIEALPLYANINRAVIDRSPKGFAAAAEQAAKDGFTAIKLSPFDEVSAGRGRLSGSTSDWRPGIERIQTVRKAVGPDVEVGVDGHRKFDFAGFLPVLEELNRLDLFWIEEPLWDAGLSGLERTSAKCGKPLAGGERLFGLEGFKPFLEKRRYDVLMPDIKHAGGIGELKSIAEGCRLNGLRFSPHNPSGPVATAASAQVAAMVPAFWMLEYAWGEVDWRARLLDPPEEIVGGKLRLSKNAGLGHALNEAAIDRHRV